MCYLCSGTFLLTLILETSSTNVFAAPPQKRRNMLNNTAFNRMPNPRIWTTKGMWLHFKT